MVDEPKKESVIARIAQEMAEQRASLEKLKYRFMTRSYQTKRIRFVSDMDEAVPVRMHWSWSKLHPTPCQSQLDRPCPYCGDYVYQTGEWYALTVWDLDQEQLLLLAGGPSSWSPIPEMMKRFEERGTLTDCVYQIKKRKRQRSISWDVVPEGGRRRWKRQFTPFSDREVYEVLNAGWKIKDL